MGPGVYPASKTPEIPAHPNCLCFLQPVVDTSIGVDDERPAAPKARRGATGEWLADQPEGVRASILGAEGSRQFSSESGRVQASVLDAATSHPARE